MTAPFGEPLTPPALTWALSARTLSVRELVVVGDALATTSGTYPRGPMTGQRCAAPRCPHRGSCARNHPRARHDPVDLGPTLARRACVPRVGARGRPLAPDSSTRDEEPIRRVGTCRRYSAGAVSSGAGVASGGSEAIASWTAAWMAGISGLPWSKFGGTTSNRTLLPLRDFRSRSPT